MSPTPNNIQAAVIQHKGLPDQASSLNQTETLIRQAASGGSKLILLQELHASLYFCQTQTYDNFALAEALEGPTKTRLSALAKELECVIVGSIFEKRMAGVYHNTAIVLDTDGSLAGIYRKMHIPDDPGFNEKFYFSPGEHDQIQQIGFTPINTSIGKLGVLVCWDQWYPEAARLMALAGAEILLYPTAIGWDAEDTKEEQQRQLDAWTLIQRSHSVANHLPTLVANRVGHEPDPSSNTQGITFWGNSFISGPQGEILAEGSNTETQILSATLDLSRTEQLRQIWPYFRDRRIDAYSALSQRSIKSQ
ncbi:acyltransferase [Gammaproteobacteria bacterium 45_16_T64]|nr:acyltransferase [Gammaproteobacteria bacterium 45_16_T64]